MTWWAARWPRIRLSGRPHTNCSICCWRRKRGALAQRPELLKAAEAAQHTGRWGLPPYASRPHPFVGG
ncbi:hypothetical protein NKG94_22610 [Micromonospora sp. M12]